jgi:phosphoribosyl 1,2-cyclic phosphodiesterase
MSLFICSLNSGSNGNCYYVGNNQDAVLIDAGISCREVELRMKRSGLDIQKVRAVFISHEHTDHISGLATLSKKFNLPVYITTQTLKHCRINLNTAQVKTFDATTPVQIESLTVSAFAKYHDACEPFSFTVQFNNTCVGVFTDLGRPCEQLIKHFKQCHAAFLEANYDEQMLDKGNYPIFLKNRIRGGNGHLSNRQALELFLAHRSPFMSHLLLSHLSRNNNSPELVQQMFDDNASGVRIIIAGRFQESPVLEVRPLQVTTETLLIPSKEVTQLELMF